VARFAYSYLAAVAVGLATGLVGVVVSAIAQATCAGDDPAYCVMARTGVAGAVIAGAFLFLAGFVVRLGWEWAAWMVALSLVVGQVVVDTGVLEVLFTLLVLPAAAAVITFERPDRAPSRMVRWLRVGVLAAVVVEVVVWLVRLLLSAR
jgi:hypothetical protein